MKPGRSVLVQRRPSPISAWCRSWPMRGALVSRWRDFRDCCEQRARQRPSRRSRMRHRTGSPMPNKTADVTMDAVYTKPGYLFRRMQQIAVAIFVEECKAYDLTPVQYAALAAIRAHPGIDATRLSAVIAFDRSTLGNVIERLESKAWVERKPSRDDKRIKLLYLTKAGEALLRSIMPSVDRAQARMLQPLKPADRQALLALITPLV